MPTCEQIQEALLVPLRDSQADARVRAHLEDCPACARLQYAHESLDRQTRSVLVLDPPAWVTSAIIEQVTAQRTAARPSVARLGGSHLAQWAIYLGVSFSLGTGLFFQDFISLGWLSDLTALPDQIVAAYEVLRSSWALLPLDAWGEALFNANWIYAVLTLAIIAWWLREGETPHPTGDGRSATSA